MGQIKRELHNFENKKTKEFGDELVTKKCSFENYYGKREQTTRKCVIGQIILWGLSQLHVESSFLVHIGNSNYLDDHLIHQFHYLFDYILPCFISHLPLLEFVV